MKRALFAPLLLFAACTSGDDLTSSERARLKAHLGEAPPPSALPLEARFNDRVSLVAYELEATEVPAGEPFELTLHFEADASFPKGTRAFTHLTDGDGNILANADRSGLVRELHPADRFRSGESIRDVITLVAPSRHRGHTELRVGFFRGDDRVRARLPGGIEADHVSIPGPRIVRGGAPRLPTLEVPRAGAVRVDGVLDEETWARAPSTEVFRHTMTGAETRVRAKARMAWDEAHVYFAVEVEDGDLRTPFTEHDAPLWEADVVELFLDPTGGGRDYLELQVSPRGVVFDTHYERRRVPKPIGNAAWSSGMEAAVRAHGTLNDSRPDRGYTVEAKVPLEALAERSPTAGELGVGHRWRANFYVIDARRGGGSAAAWSPPLVGDFHYPPRFGRLVFVD